MSNPKEGKMPLTDGELLSFLPGMYDGGSKGDCDIRCYTTAIVHTRKPHDCPGNFSGQLHAVAAGSRMVREHALVEGKWSTCYTCEECISAWARECGQLAEESNG